MRDKGSEMREKEERHRDFLRSSGHCWWWCHLGVVSIMVVHTEIDHSWAQYPTARRERKHLREGIQERIWDEREDFEMISYLGWFLGCVWAVLLHFSMWRSLQSQLSLISSSPHKLNCGLWSDGCDTHGWMVFLGLYCCMVFGFGVGFMCLFPKKILGLFKEISVIGWILNLGFSRFARDSLMLSSC